MDKDIKNRKDGGYAVVTALIFFLAASMAVIAGLSDSVFRETRAVRNEGYSKQAYFTSESALEDAMYRIKSGKNIGGSGSLALDASSASYTVLSGDAGVKEVVSVGDLAGIMRSTKAVLRTGEGVSFAFAIQAGLGGIDLLGGSGVIGDIYTTGSLRGCGSCSVSGEASAAGRTASSTSVDNGVPIPPGNSIVFGDSNATQDIAQSFTLSAPESVLEAGLYIKKIGNPANASVKLVLDEGGEPGDSVLASGTLFSSLIFTSYSWQDVVMTSNPLLEEGVEYWLVVDGGSNPNNRYEIASNLAYPGKAKIGRMGDDWSDALPSGTDVYFRIKSGTTETGITGASPSQRLSLGGAHAYEVSNSIVSGDLYCQTGSDNNKECDTSRADPEVKEYPVPDSKIETWKSQAATSVFNDDYSVGKPGATLGPKKIEGNLSISGEGTLSVSGTIWVTGDISITGNSFMQPADSSKSYVVIADGIINLAGGSEIKGSDGSHILLISLSSADPAVTINGGANDTVVFAPRGGIAISGNSLIRAGSAKHISADGGASITYDPELADLNFSSGVADLDFHISSWKEVE